MKTIKLLKIALLSVIMSSSVSVGTAYAQGFSDFDVMQQVAEAFASLDNHEQLMLLKTINQWDDYTSLVEVLIEIGKEAGKEIGKQFDKDKLVNQFVETVKEVAKEIGTDELVNQFVERGKDVVEFAKRKYDSYQNERHERA